MVSQPMRERLRTSSTKTCTAFDSVLESPSGTTTTARLRSISAASKAGLDLEHGEHDNRANQARDDDFKLNHRRIPLCFAVDGQQGGRTQFAGFGRSAVGGTTAVVRADRARRRVIVHLDDHAPGNSHGCS